MPLPTPLDSASRPAVVKVGRYRFLSFGVSAWPWYRWGPWAVILSVAIGGGAGAWLLRQPNSTGNCNYVFWPFASAAFRLYCAQEAADEKTLEGIMRGIQLIDALPLDHPLAPEINRRLQAWSAQALDLSEASFQAGEYERAVKFAQSISPHAAVYPQVQSRLDRWQRIWAEGSRIYTQAETALRNLEWREAFHISLKLQDVDCRYWSDVQAGVLSERIIQVQRQDQKLGEARRLMARGGRENLVAALEIIQQIKVNQDIYPGAMRLISQVSQDLAELSEQALRQGNYSEALAAAEKIPANVAIWGQAQDLMRLAMATELAQAGMGQDIPTAIKQAQAVRSQSPVYNLAQALVQEWQTDLHVLRTLAQAQQIAQSGRPQDLVAATTLLKMAPWGSRFRQQQLRTQQQQWRTTLETQEDQPILAQAEASARLGTPAGLEHAIRLLQQIRPGRPLYTQAQNRIQALLPQPDLTPSAIPAINTTSDMAQAWLQQAKAQAELGTPATLALAIETASQVPTQSDLRPEAETLILEWGNQILNAAATVARQDVKSGIEIAQQIPPKHPLYGAAQQQIEAWQRLLATPSPEPSPAATSTP